MAIKELKKHNATTRSPPSTKRAVNTHDTDPSPEQPPTDTPTGDPTPPESPADPDLDNTTPCEDFTFDDSTLAHIMDTYSPSYSINKAHIYHVSKHSSSHYGSLIDRGANGGLAGSDVRILERTGRTVSVTGIDNHELPGLDIVTCAALLPTNHGKVVLIMHEYAYYGRGNTIHSPGQIEWFQNICDDKSFHVGGKQVINFLEGYSTPLQCRTGLMYMSLLGKPTDADLNTYPHVLLTGPHEWDPCVLDYTHPTTSGDPTWAPDPSLLGAHDPRIDDFGNFKGRVQHTHISHIAQYKHAITPQPIDFERLRPYFGWVNKHTIEKTYHKTTQWAVASTRYPMRKHFKSRFPAFNISRRSEEVATDTIFSDTPAIDSGVTMAQIFVGKRTLVTDVYPLKSQKQFVNTLEDNIRFRGAMTKLISDYAKVEISHKVKDILRMYHSSSWNSEPYHQNQNPAEGRYCTLKSWTNTIMNRSGAPADCWLLCMIHASYILNHLSCEALGGNVPLGMLYGVSPDISILLLYTFYQPVFYATHNQSYPSSSEERAARWVGFGEHVGDALTHKLLDADTKKILYRSAVRPSDSAHPNKRSVSDGGESSQTPKPIVFVRSRQDDNQSATKPNVFEQIPKDAPEPLGKSVTTTTFLDANLLHDLITGRSVTAVLHFFNLTPGDWYSKRQATVENATYGSEFVAAKTATEQIIDIRQTLRYLGVPIKSKAYMFGDNKSVVTSSTVPHSLLSKRHNILSYHRVREAIAAKILVFHWCDSSQNKSDILSKHWEFSKVFHIIRDLFDFQGKISLIQ